MYPDSLTTAGLTYGCLKYCILNYGLIMVILPTNLADGSNFRFITSVIQFLYEANLFLWHFPPPCSSLKGRFPSLANYGSAPAFLFELSEPLFFILNPCDHIFASTTPKYLLKVSKYTF